MKLIARIPDNHDRGQTRITTHTIKDQISDKLAYMIHSGLLRVGDELPSERDLAITLGVSRATVRGAIGVLQARQMIEINQGARTRVLGTGPLSLYESVSTLRHLGDRSFEEVSEAREVVEVQVVRLAAARITPAALARLEELVHDQDGMLNDPVRFQISDRVFHATLYEACGNPLLVDVISDFYDYALEFRRLAMQRPGAIARSVADHHAIVAALASGSADAAVKAAQAHLDQVHKTTLKEMGR